jgi:hypothetical protein
MPVKMSELHAVLIRRLQREIDQLLADHIGGHGSINASDRRKKVLNALKIFLLPSEATEEDSSSGEDEED